MTVKCVCGYEKIGKIIDDNGHYGDADPEKEDFKEIRIIGKVYDEWLREFNIKELTLKVCPECGTVKMEGF